MTAVKKAQFGQVVTPAVVPPEKWAWHETNAILFAPRETPKWTVQDLGIAPGRPGILSGPSGGAKTIIAQALALALASGRAPWGTFSRLTPIVVAHIDMDLGLEDTIFRYRRLCAGWPGGPLTEEDLGGRLRLCSYPDPGLDLVQPNARELLKRELVGVDFCIMDALRGLASGNENDSQFARALYTVAGFSSDTGIAAMLLHHTGNTKFDAHGKPVDDDESAGRGTSAIKGAAGVILRIAGSQEKGRTLWMAKPPGRTGVQWGKKKYAIQIDDVDVAPELTPKDWASDRGFGLHVSAIEKKEKTEATVDEAAKVALHAEHQQREAILAVARAAGLEGFKGGIDKLLRPAREAFKKNGGSGITNTIGRQLAKELGAEGLLKLTGRGSATRIFFHALAPVEARNLAEEGSDDAAE